VEAIGRLLVGYWGYLAIILAIFGYFEHAIGLVVVLVLALAAFGYFLIQAPLWCGAEIRGGGFCRNNSYDILIGCHFRQHKWQLVRQVFKLQGAGMVRKVMRSVNGKIVGGGATVAAITSIATAVPLIIHSL
jgi:hypothetical protein